LNAVLLTTDTSISASNASWVFHQDSIAIKDLNWMKADPSGGLEINRVYCMLPR
jgi:hypothetical protein